MVLAEGRRLLITARLIAVGTEASVTSRNTTGATGPAVCSMNPTSS
jgi:hypothetical protein